MDFPGYVVKGVHLTVFRRKLVLAIERIIENEGIIYNEGEKGLRTHFFTCILLKLLRKIELPERLKLNRNFRRYMKERTFQKVYLAALSILFSQDYFEVSRILGFSCCVNGAHYGFCRLKWEELNSFAMEGFLKMMGVKFVRSLRGDLEPIEVDVDSLLE